MTASYCNQSLSENELLVPYYIGKANSNVSDGRIGDYN